MSAYVVSNETISVLVKGFEIYGVDYKAENYEKPIQIIIDMNELRKGIGQSLLEQNYKSVNERYGENELVIPEFIYKDLDVDAGMIYGCIQCYEYQACETDDYFESKLHYSLIKLKDAMLKRYIRNENLEIPYGYNGYDVEK